MKRTTTRRPSRLADLKPASYNPRSMTKDALQALQQSLSAFGDISGVVWNSRTGNLVAGHQRLKALRAEHGNKLKLEDGAIVTPTGERFPVRVVDWPESREQAANVAANSPLLAGRFSEGLKEVLDAINAELPDLSKSLRLDELILAPFDRETEWQGMPECHQEDHSAFRQITVNFSSQRNVDAFSRLVNQTITKDTRSLWYPKAKVVQAHDKRYVDES